MNLLTNSVKYQDAGKIQIFSRLLELGDKDLIEVIVKDEGAGMSEQQLENLFMPLNYANSMDKKFTSDVSNRVGLSICKQIVNQFDGEITATSEPQKGTTFKFTMRVFRKDDRLSRLNHRELNQEGLLNMSLILEESEDSRKSLPVKK